MSAIDWISKVNLNARFSDFVITRITKAKILERAPLEDAEGAKADKQWNLK